MKYIYALLISLLLPTAVFAQSVPVSWLRNVASGFLTPLNISDNVGIGTTSPAGNLEVNGSAGIYSRNSSGGRIVFDDSDVAAASTPMSYIIGADGALQFGRANRAVSGLTTGSVESLRITSTGNVGIGTTTPNNVPNVSEKLVVTGDVFINNITNSTGLSLGSLSSSAAYIQSSNAGNTSVKYLVLQPSGGNIGIGTTSPATKLDVAGDITADYQKVFGIRNSGSTIASVATVNNGTIGPNAAKVNVGRLVFSGLNGWEVGSTQVGIAGSLAAGNLNTLTFQTNTTEQMRIDASGNVGIGTTTPWTKLAVTGSTTIAGGPLFVLGTSNTPIGADTDWYRGLAQFRKDINDYMYVTMENRNGGANASSDFIWNNDKTTSTTYYADAGYNSSGYNNPSFGNLNAPNGWYLYNTDGPILWATATTSTAGYFDVTTGGYSSSRFRITSTGFIGAGTTSPSSILELAAFAPAITLGSTNTLISGGATYGDIDATSADPSGPGTMTRIRSKSVDGNFGGDSELTFWTKQGGNSMAEKMRLNNLGNLLIGTTSSQTSAFLTVENVSARNSFLVTDQAFDTTPFIIDSAGNVGISTSTPQSTLSVGSVNDATNSYAQIDSVNGAPTAGDCDTDLERGRMIIDYSNNRFYICNGATRGWDYTALTD